MSSLDNTQSHFQGKVFLEEMSLSLVSDDLVLFVAASDGDYVPMYTEVEHKTVSIAIHSARLRARLSYRELLRWEISDRASFSLSLCHSHGAARGMDGRSCHGRPCGGHAASGWSHTRKSRFPNAMVAIFSVRLERPSAPAVFIVLGTSPI